MVPQYQPDNGSRTSKGCPATAVEKVSQDICRFFEAGVDLDFAGKIPLPGLRSNVFEGPDHRAWSLVSNMGVKDTRARLHR